MKRQKRNKKRVNLSFLTVELNTKTEKEFFFENLAQMLSSGISVVSALEALLEETRNKSINFLISEVKEEVENGLTLWKSLEKRKVLPSHLLTLVRVGEESGNLAKNLAIVIEQQNKDREFSSKLRSASLYPIIVLVLLSVVASAVALFILPRLASVYSSLKVELPFITTLLIELGRFLELYGFIALPLFFMFLFLTIYVIFFNKKTKIIGQRIIFKIKLTRNIVTETEIARMGYLMGTLLKSGFTAADALQLLGSSTSFYIYKEFYNYLFDAIQNGWSFKQAFFALKKINRIIPLYPRQMIISGEQSGKLAESFIKIGELFEQKNEETSKNIGAIIEPILLIIIWLGVAAIALAVILPIYSLIGDLTNISSGQTTVESNK